jgi:gamma-glutamyltranspeptidase/glutathione hydrolase
MFRQSRALFALAVCLAITSAPVAQVEHLVLDGWTQDEVAHYYEMQHPAAQSLGLLRTSAVAQRAMIAGTSEPFAIHAGFKVLEQGGSAVDAALTTSLAQVALTAGAAISYAGLMTAVYYDAKTATVYSLNAGYNTVKGETDPLSIPPFPQHSGRTALVPGFMAGVEALHKRFGRLKFEQLFGPAISIAGQGVPFTPLVAAWLRQAKPFVTRLPEGKRIFTKEDGTDHAVGDLFQQPELAATLTKVAARGAAYMYTGEWANRFVEAVQREGGKMALSDLAAYSVQWQEPAVVSYRDHEVATLGNPSSGGRLTAWNFALAEEANLAAREHYATSPESLFDLIQISRNANRLGFSGADPTRETAAAEWNRIRNTTSTTSPIQTPATNHSAGVIALDDHGNVAVVLHTINGLLWGSTGLFVDGVSIPDSASLQQPLVDRAGPGNRLGDTTNPLIVLKSGKPVLASVAIGSALHQVTLQNVLNILDFGKDPKSSVAIPNTRGPYLGVTVNAPPQPNYQQEAVAEGDFAEAVLDGVRERGQQIRVLPSSDQSQMGYWIGIQIDPKTGELSGAASPKLNSLVEGL